MVGAIALAGAIMCLRILFIVGVFNSVLLITLLPIMLSAAVVQSVIGTVLVSTGTKRPHDELIWKNPFDVSSALRFALFIGVILMLSTLAARNFGSEALFSVSAIAGIADVDAITLSLARMAEPSANLGIVTDSILIAALTNTVTKAVLAGFAGGNATGWRVAAVNLAAVLTALATYLLMGA
jgi:uncharacterized membrane protein (DUF4010 family)